MRHFLVTLVVLFCFLTLSVDAGIFSDVPSGHPALASIETLSEKGIITGLNDKTFAGGRGVTRYELAMAVFRAMARLEEQISADCPAVSDEDLYRIDYLKNEFADELGLLGLRVELAQNRKELLREEIDRLRADIRTTEKAVKNTGEKVKMTGEWMTRHTWKTHREDHARSAFGVARPGNSNNSLTESQIRLRMTAKVDENITMFTRFRLFNRGSDVVTAMPSARGGAFGTGGIGAQTTGDMQVDCAFLEIKKVFHDDDWFLIGRSTLQTGHGLLLNADLDAIRYDRLYNNDTYMAQYIFDRHKGSYKDDGRVDFRGVANLGFSRKLQFSSYYANVFAQDNPDTLNKRTANAVKHGTGAREMRRDRRRDLEIGYTGKFGKNRRFTADVAVALTDYRASIGKVTAADLDVDLKGMAGHTALAWKATQALSAKLAYNWGDDRFAGGYSLSLDRRYSDSPETNIEDIARGNNWFRNGLINMGDLKAQVEYHPAGKHYFRLAADFLRELKDRVGNDLSHYQAKNYDGIVPVGFVVANSAYDNFNNIGIADPSLRLITFEYRYKLTKNTRLRVGAVKCDFSGDAFKSVGGARPVAAGRGFRGDYDYQMVWAEVFGRF